MSQVIASDGLTRYIRSRWPEWIVILSFAAIVAIAIPYHEPWVDDAQAWQLARSLSLSSLFRSYIRYEGSPGLWHFLLWLMIRTHISYEGMHWFCGAIAVLSTSILVLKSPFPRYLKLLLPFTYFLLFQYAVVGRSYVLVPPMLFLIASWWKKHPAAVVILLGLLANVALHSAVLSGGLAIVFCIQRAGEGQFQRPEFRRKFLLLTPVLLGFYSFAIWTAWPPRDLPLVRVAGQHQSYYAYVIGSLVWGVCQPWILSIPFWIVMGLWLHSRRSLYFLIPVLLFALFSGVAFADWWHVGLLFPTILCLLWTTWPESAITSPRYELIGRVALILVVGSHICWSAYAIIYDHYHAYSPDPATADFLRPYVRRGATIAVTYVKPAGSAYSTTGILPYFNHSIYANQPNGFWSWSNNNPTEDLFLAILPSRPSIIVAENFPSPPGSTPSLKDPKVELLERSGYRLINVFCGSMPERLELGITYCHLIFQSAGEPTAQQTEQDSHAERPGPS